MTSFLPSFLLYALWMNQGMNGSPSFLPLFQYSLLYLFSFGKKKKKKDDLTLKIKNLKNTIRKKKKTNNKKKTMEGERVAAKKHE